MHVETSAENVLIIGNGFDLNLGLKTGYSDFMNSSHFQELVIKENLLAVYLNSKQNHNWIDIEKELKNYSKNEANTHRIAKDFEDNYLEISNSLINYLKEINYSKINKESPAYRLIRNTVKSNFSIIDFNYTDTTKLILKDIGFIDSEIVNRHFKVHGSVEEGKIIFGVEDSADLRRNHVFLLKSYPIHYKAINFIREISRAVKVDFFGHSLGESDHTYFNYFFERCSNGNFNERSKTLNFHFYGQEGYKSLHKELYSLTNSRVANFKQFNEVNYIDSSL